MVNDSPVRYSKTAGRLMLAIQSVTDILRAFEDQQSPDIASRDSWMLCLGTMASQLDMIMTLESLVDLEPDEEEMLGKMHRDALDMLALVEGLLPELV